MPKQIDMFEQRARQEIQSMQLAGLKRLYAELAGIADKQGDVRVNLALLMGDVMRAIGYEDLLLLASPGNVLRRVHGDEVARVAKFFDRR